jgi:rare lipoprotein A
MSEEEMKKRTGELILESQRIKLYAEGILRNREWAESKKLAAIAIWIVILIVVAYTLIACKPAHAFTTEASYYTTASCIKEGTSGVTTASGGRFDENAYTCASWDYRFGQKLLVSYKGRSVVVTVNDRGPSKKLYAKGRRLDLSAGAFSKLAPLARGIISVEVKEI